MDVLSGVGDAAPYARFTIWLRKGRPLDAPPVGRPLGAAAKMAAVGRRGTIPPVGGNWPKDKRGRDKPPPYQALTLHDTINENLSLISTSQKGK